MKPILLFLALTACTQAQTPDPHESPLAADFRVERRHLSEACGTFGLKSTAGCAVELFTDHPFHIAAGSIAPQNGFGVGAAMVAHYTPNETWRLSWNFDAVASTNASWRAGAYMKMIHTPVQKQVTTVVHPYTVFNLYAQSISLNQLNFFGVGPDSTLAGKSLFGMTQSIIGFSAIKPVYEFKSIRKLNLSLIGQANGRFVSLRPRHGQSSPSIENLYTEASAPGLANQPAFLQLEEGIRLKPSLFNNNLQFNYLANFQEFYAPSTSRYNFQRWTIDLDHRIPLHTKTQSYAPRDTNGPDECAAGSEKDAACPPVSYSWNLQGSINFRFLLSESMNSAAVPFYFQQTLGGSDINGAPALTSYQDYRFRPQPPPPPRKLRTLSVGTFRVPISGRPGQSSLNPRRYRVRPPKAQLRHRPNPPRRRLSPSLPPLRLGRRNLPHHRRPEHLATRRLRPPPARLMNQP